MTIAHSIQQIPRILDHDTAGHVASLWGQSGSLGDLIKGTAGSSPYLAQVLTDQCDWLQAAVQRGDPLTPMMDTLAQVDDMGAALRQAKSRVAGYVGLAELSRAQDIMTGTQQLTDFADRAVDLAMTDALRPFVARGKLPADVPWFAIAMGKMGAGELNFSSDIDLILMLDDSDMSRIDALEYRAQLVKVAQRAIKTLSETTLGGYVFRTDVRLRPDPSVTPIVVCTSQALTYYRTVGRTWERAAFIKARACAGHVDNGQAFLTQLVPFIWRKYLDFFAIEEAHELRQKIRHKIGQTDAITLPGHNVKLGRGGIREIEFFTQTRQLIAAGRDPNLRGRATLPSLQALVDAGWVKAKAAHTLSTHYKSLRHVEHALQMVRDRQTQAVPAAPEDRDRIAALLGQSLPEFETQLFETLSEVHTITDRFFTPAEAAVFDVISPLATKTERWKDIPSLQNETAAKLFDQILPCILRGLEDAADPDEAVLQFESFLRGIPSGVQVFSLFAANPSLVQFITKIIAVSPALAEYLGYNARVLDAVVSGDFFGPIPGKDVLSVDLQEKLQDAEDYEAKLITARAWKREWHFRIGAQLIDGLITPPDAALHYANLADAILATVLDVVTQNFAATYGHIKDARLCVLGMGSLGAQAVSATSDLDLLVIFDAKANLESDGRRSLATRVYFARLTQALITALTAPMPGGILYEVDMRLRPSGKAGPVATHLARFSDYYQTEAWTWEHLALTRARPVAGDADFCRRIDELRVNILESKSTDTQVMCDVADMRRRLAQEKPQRDMWDMKNGPGGAMDIELFAQSLALTHGSSARAVANQLALLSDHDGLADTHKRLMDLKQLHGVLCKSGGKKTFAFGAGGWSVVNAHCQIANEDQLNTQTQTRRQQAAMKFDDYIAASNAICEG